MNVARFIARRYSKAKKTRNVINLISSISVVGIAVSTAALIILLSAFNGIEQMVIKLYSDFDTSLTVRSKKSKTFNQDFINIEGINQILGIDNVSRALEEVVILRLGDKWVHAKMLGVDSSFLEMSHMDNHLVDGKGVLYEDDVPQAIFGATLLDKLDGFIPEIEGFQEEVVFNVPLREGKIRLGKNPFNVQVVPVSARMNFNREVNAEYVVVPYDLANELLDYDRDITAVFIDVNDKFNLKKVKNQVQTFLGEDFEVKTNFEKNELIFKTSQTERLIVFFILVFIFILASFNLIASITMLFVEKRKDIATLFSLGADKKMIFNIFFYEGLMIVGKGIIIGLILGYVVALGQYYFGFVEMPSITGEAFPMYPMWKDFFIITGSVSILGYIISYFPSKILVNRYNLHNSIKHL